MLMRIISTVLMTSPKISKCGERSSLDLIRQIQEEIEDICGWSVGLWARLEALRRLAAKVDEDAANHERPARGAW